MQTEQDALGHDVARHWEQVAGQWIVWARTSGHDAFWSYRDEFRRFLPAPGASTLEIGCGEGRIARELTSLGHAVTAIDLSLTLLGAARAAGPAARYAVADAAQLPFTDGGFDRVVAYNVLMDVADMPAVVAEAARVLAPSGTLTLSIVHPFTDRGAFTSRDPDAAFTIEGSYYGRRYFRGTEARDGLSMDFAGWSHPLEDYTAALSAAGLVITELREPRPAASDQRRNGRWTRMPLFCWINAQHLHRTSAEA